MLPADSPTSRRCHPRAFKLIGFGGAVLRTSAHNGGGRRSSDSIDARSQGSTAASSRRAGPRCEQSSPHSATPTTTPTTLSPWRSEGSGRRFAARRAFTGTHHALAVLSLMPLADRQEGGGGSMTRWLVSMSTIAIAFAAGGRRWISYAARRSLGRRRSSRPPLRRRAAGWYGFGFLCSRSCRAQRRSSSQRTGRAGRPTSTRPAERCAAFQREVELALMERKFHLKSRPSV